MRLSFYSQQCNRKKKKRQLVIGVRKIERDLMVKFSIKDLCRQVAKNMVTISFHVKGHRKTINNPYNITTSDFNSHRIIPVIYSKGKKKGA